MQDITFSPYSPLAYFFKLPSLRFLLLTCALVLYLSWTHFS